MSSTEPGWSITRVGDRITRRNPTIEVWAERGAEKRERLFDPYTGADLGDSVTQGEYFVLWLARLHDELLLDRPGRYWNGILSLVATILFITGLVVWWPGLSRWKRSLLIKGSSGWRRFNWDLHSAIGFWMFLFMLMWGISGFYLGVPEPLTGVGVTIADPDAYRGMERHLVTEALVAAKLSRSLERPRVEIDGRFARAVRLAEQHGSYRQKLEATYEHIWTGFWWFDDFLFVNTSYDGFEERALASR